MSIRTVKVSSTQPTLVPLPVVMQPSKINCRIQSTDGEVLIVDMLDVNKQSVGLNKQTNRDLSFEVNMHPGNPYNLAIQTSSPNPTNVQVEFQVHTSQEDPTGGFSRQVEQQVQPSELDQPSQVVQPSQGLPISQLQYPSPSRPSFLQRVIGYLKTYKWYVVATVILGGVVGYYWLSSRYSSPRKLASLIAEDDYEYTHSRVPKSRTRNRRTDKEHQEHQEYKEVPVYAPDDDEYSDGDNDEEDDHDVDEMDNSDNEDDEDDEDASNTDDEDTQEDESDDGAEADGRDEVVEYSEEEAEDNDEEDATVEHGESHGNTSAQVPPSSPIDHSKSVQPVSPEKSVKSDNVVYEEIKPDTSVHSFKPKEPIAMSTAKQLRIPSLLRSTPALYNK